LKIDVLIDYFRRRNIEMTHILDFAGRIDVAFKLLKANQSIRSNFLLNEILNLFIKIQKDFNMIDTIAFFVNDEFGHFIEEFDFFYNASEIFYNVFRKFFK